MSFSDFRWGMLKIFPSNQIYQKYHPTPQLNLFLTYMSHDKNFRVRETYGSIAIKDTNSSESIATVLIQSQPIYFHYS